MPWTMEVKDVRVSFQKKAALQRNPISLWMCIRKEKNRVRGHNKRKKRIFFFLPNTNLVRVHKEIRKEKKQRNIFLPNLLFPSSHLCEFMGIDWSATQGGSAEIFAMHERRRGG